MTGATKAPADDRRSWTIAAAVVALGACLPVVRGVAAGHAFFFRDLSRQFFPLRLFALEGLRQGELRFWNPFNHEGLPLPFSPIGYPLELLELLRPTEVGLSLALALHVPLCALGFVLLARHLRLPPTAAAGGALVYALGGFGLSTLNFYVYLHAMAWAPFVVWGLLRAAEGGRRRLAMAAVVGGIALSTAGVEIAAQAFLAGGVLAFRRHDLTRLLRVAAAGALSLGVAAPVVLVMRGTAAGTARAHGFSADVVLNQSIHPFTWLQVLVGQLYGDLAGGADRWWGANFFENGFPYMLSLYLGAAAIALAVGGLGGTRPERLRVLLLAVAAAVVCLGRFAGWAAVIDTLPAALRAFRFPTKAFFTVHLAVALLAAFGLEALSRAHRRGQALAAAAGIGLGGALVGVTALPAIAPAQTAWFITHFFPPGIAPRAGAVILEGMLADAAVGGGVAAVLGLLALGALRGVLAPAPASLLAIALLGGDLLRTGAGLNPMVGPGFFRLSPEMHAVLAETRPTRIHTCEPMRADAYWQGRAARPGAHEAFTFAVWRETLAPHFNMGFGVRSALTEDTTSLVPVSRVPPAGLTCRRFEAMAPLLREAGVTHVTSLDPLASPDLTLVATARPAAIAPAVVHLYALAGAQPRLALEPAGTLRVVRDDTDRLEVETAASAPGRLVVRDGDGGGWSATVNGRAAAIESLLGRHRAVAVPAGPALVEICYHAPGWRPGLAVMGATLVLLAWLARRRDAPPAQEAERG